MASVYVVQPFVLHWAVVVGTCVTVSVNEPVLFDHGPGQAVRGSEGGGEPDQSVLSEMPAKYPANRSGMEKRGRRGVLSMPAMCIPYQAIGARVTDSPNASRVPSPAREVGDQRPAVTVTEHGGSVLTMVQDKEVIRNGCD